jgi:hypothetical protein
MRQSSIAGKVVAGALLALPTLTNSMALAAPSRITISKCSHLVAKVRAGRSCHDMLKACEANGGTIPGKSSSR